MKIFKKFLAWFYPIFGTSHDFYTTKVYWNSKLNIFPGGIWSNLSIRLDWYGTSSSFSIHANTLCALYQCSIPTRTNSYVFCGSWYVFDSKIQFFLSKLETLKQLVHMLLVQELAKAPNSILSYFDGNAVHNIT